MGVRGLAAAAYEAAGGHESYVCAGLRCFVVLTLYTAERLRGHGEEDGAGDEDEQMEE
jgi:hypothetical protein